MGNYPYRHNFDSIDGICEMNATDSQGITPPHRRNMGLGVSYGQTTTPLQEAKDPPDLSETHTLIDVPKWGKVWVVNDISKYYQAILDWHDQTLSQELQAFAEQILEKLPKKHKLAYSTQTSYEYINQKGYNQALKDTTHIIEELARQRAAEILRGVQND